MKEIDGLVVLYNPEASVIDHIQSYAHGIRTLYIIDNSENADQAVIEQIQSTIPNGHYINNESNQGIAFALNQGAKLAMANGAQWLLTMDQDSEFTGSDFLELVAFTTKQDIDHIGLVSPFHQTAISVAPVTDVDEVLTIMTSGNLINLSAWQAIDGFDEHYFIDAVDWDYCLRLKLNGFKVLRYNKVKLTHGLGNASRHKSVTGKQITALNYGKVRRYYITRNKLIIITKYLRSYPRFSYNIFKSLFRDLRHILLYENGKAGKLNYMIKGFAHFLIGKGGKL